MFAFRLVAHLPFFGINHASKSETSVVLRIGHVENTLFNSGTFRKKDCLNTTNKTTVIYLLIYGKFSGFKVNKEFER